MQLEDFEKLQQKISDADMVLVGLGEEWVLTEERILNDLEKKDKVLHELFSKVYSEERFQKILPLLTAYYYENHIPETFKRAYRNLLELLDGKNYFVVSLTVDSYLKKMGFKEERCVNPCGTYEKLQCEEGCNSQLELSTQVLDEVKSIIESAKEIDQVSQIISECALLTEKYRCNACGAEMAFNLLDTKRYLEEGYLEQWQIYMKWLQGTLNRKLCVIEAGVGMKLPSVIRWPFEKTVFYNQKASMIRIHQKYYQVNEEVADRAYGCQCHSVELFKEKNVEA